MYTYFLSMVLHACKSSAGEKSTSQFRFQNLFILQRMFLSPAVMPQPWLKHPRDSYVHGLGALMRNILT